MKSNSHKRGEVVIGLLVGIVVGGIILLINTGNEAQAIANSTGVDTSPIDVMVDQPGESLLTIFGPAAAGAGIGWAIDELSGKKDDPSNQNNVTIDGDGNVVVIGGDGAGSGDGDVDNSENTETGL